METHRRRTLPWGLFPALVTLLPLGTGLGVEWAIRRKGPLALRAAWALALLSTFLMVWVNMATGLLGGESNPVNMLLLTVPVLGIAGAMLARLQPRGMAFTLLAMAALQLALTAIAASQGWRLLRQGPINIWGPNGFFILLFLSAAALFLDSAQVNRRLPAAMMILLGIAIGTGGVIVGAIDDAPGASLIGVVLMLGLVVLGIRLARGKHGIPG